MFTVGRISQSNVGFMCEVRLVHASERVVPAGPAAVDQIWGLCWGKTRAEATRRAEITVRALNRERAN